MSKQETVNRSGKLVKTRRERVCVYVMLCVETDEERMKTVQRVGTGDDKRQARARFIFVIVFLDGEESCLSCGKK